MLRSYTIRRSQYFLAVIVLALSAVLPVVISQKASAYGLLVNREIKISSSATSATGVSYYVEFDAGTTATVKSIVVDFCSDSPILNASCAGTVGTTVPNLGASPTVDTNGGVGIGNIGTGWTAGQLNANRTLTLTKATGVAMTSGTAYYFTITGVANPSALGTFYGRILTFPNDVTSNYAGGYTPTNLGTNVPTDAGGIALSTAAQITVTAKVQERLVFCVYTTGAGNDCTGKSGTSVLLGDTNGVLDPAGVYVDKNAKYSITTNAAGSAVIRAKGATLTSGSFTINAFGAPNTSTPGTEEFGFCSYQSTGTGMTIHTDYDGAAGAPAAECSGTSQTAGTGTPGGDNSAQFGFVTANLASTYGADVATKPAGDYSTGIMVFAGNISNTTEAGTYVTTLTFIATGTY